MNKKVYFRIFPIALIILLVFGIVINFINYSVDFNIKNFLQYESKYLNIIDTKDYIFLSTKTINSSDYYDTSIVFYSGAFVDERSYLPLLSELAKEGMNVYIIKSLINFNLFTTSKVNNILKNDNCKNVVFMGHSLGGTSLLRYIYNNKKYEYKIAGVVLLASYGIDKYDFSNSNIRFLSIVGSNDGIINFEKHESYKSKLPINTLYGVIDGGNHSYFGNYGFQRGDIISDINIEKQQYFVIKEILKLSKEI